MTNYLGRLRDRHFIGAQAEYRMLPLWFSKRLGAAVFASAGAIAPSINKFEARHMRYAGGIGLRYLLFPKKDIYLRFDLGFNPYIYFLSNTNPYGNTMWANESVASADGSNMSSYADIVSNCSSHTTT